MEINWTELIISLCSLIITGILIPLIRSKQKQIEASLSEDQQATIEYWTDVAVRWAKQWLQSETGETKKLEVYNYLHEKMLELNIHVSLEDLDKIIEAVYERVKTEVSEG